MTQEEKRKILVIDDDVNLAAIMKIKMPKDTFDMTFATTGQEGLEHLKNQEFDLIVLDLNLEFESGINVLKEVRLKFNQFELPVLMVTASENPKDVLEALASGANDYISKSLNWKIKTARIHNQIEFKKLHSKAIKAQQLQALNGLIITYNHEINNPLTVVIGGVSQIQKKEEIKNQKNLDRIIRSLERIRVVVKKMERVLESDVEFEDYGEDNKMIKIHK